MSARVVVVAYLHVQPGRHVEFRRFETEAARIMARHGGRIERVIVPLAAGDGAAPDEIHVVTFPSPGAFDAYRADPALGALAPLREAAIARTEVTVGHEGEPYA